MPALTIAANAVSFTANYLPRFFVGDRGAEGRYSRLRNPYRRGKI
jgi:hypothetical protein